VHGRAPRIDYDADKTLVSFHDSSYTYGTDEGRTQLLSYNFTDGVTRTMKGNITVQSDEKVPAPRTPDRTTAK
jgi:hypothetical protein